MTCRLFVLFQIVSRLFTKGVIVEVAETEELFNNPIHPYTQGLAFSGTNPRSNLGTQEGLEGLRSKSHDYETDKPSMVEMGPGQLCFGPTTKPNWRVTKQRVRNPLLVSMNFHVNFYGNYKPFLLD